MNLTYNIIPDNLTSISSLIVEIGENGLSILPYNADSKEVSGLHHYDFASVGTRKKDWSAEIFPHDLTLPQYAEEGFSADIFVNTVEMIFVPLALYSAGQNEDLLALQFGEAAEMKIFSGEILSSDIMCIYRIQQKTIDYIMERFPHATIRNSRACRLLSIKPEPELHCVINDSTIEITLTANENLLLSQCYNYKEAADVLYYILNACKQNGIDPAEIMVVLSGKVELDSALYKLLEDYILNISLPVVPPQLILGSNMAEVPHHYFYSLYLLAVCGS